MKLEILYPEQSGLFGDAMNPEMLIRALPELETVKTPLKSCPEFISGGADMVYIGSMTERSQELCAKALMPYREQIAQSIDKGTVFLVTGNAVELFGKYIEDDNGEKHKMLGLFDFHVKRRMMNRYNSLYHGKFGDIDIVGFMSRFSHMYGGADSTLFETIRGAGREPGAVPEGIRKNNFLATYVLGPLLVLNPPFLKYIIKLLGFPLPKDGLPFESAAMEAYNQRLLEYRDPKTVETF